MFKHELLNLAPLERIEKDGKRYYITPDGVFPSVTTVLGEKLDKSGLEIWKARVGPAEVEKVSRLAANRGTAIHKLCEDYLMNVEIDARKVMPFNMMMFNTIKPILAKNVSKVYGIESMLYSKVLKAAGTSDLLAEYNGINSIIDFKTSKKEKKEEWIQNYFIQATTYSIMAEELTDLKFPQIVIIIANDDYETQVFVKNRDDYKERVLEIFG
jgi:genome maintenance exonuclease 1